MMMTKLTEINHNILDFSEEEEIIRELEALEALGDILDILGAEEDMLEKAILHILLVSGKHIMNLNLKGNQIVDLRDLVLVKVEVQNQKEKLVERAHPVRNLGRVENVHTSEMAVHVSTA